MNKNNTIENNYRIFRVEERKNSIFPKKITMVRIHAKDNDDAYNQLKDYIKFANRKYNYYVETWSPSIVIRNGKKYTYDDIFDAWAAEKKDTPIIKRIWDSISIWCWRWFKDRPMNVYYWVRNICYLLKNKQQYHASWCIDDILLDTLAFNIPILKKYKHCLSWKMLDKAILEKNKDMKPSDLEAYHMNKHSGYGDEIEKRSVELEHQMFDELLNNIRAYKYYMGDYEYIDKNNKELVETDKKLRHTLPLIKGSYDRYDYKKLNALIERYWNRIWETVRIYGREFND